MSARDLASRLPSNETGDVRADLRALKASIANILRDMDLGEGAWIEIGSTGAPAFKNSWSNIGGGIETAAYYINSAGIVRFKGCVTGGTVGAGTPIFTLPVGYRPSATGRYAIDSNSAFGSIRVEASGDVTCVVGNNASAFLSGITFRIA